MTTAINLQIVTSGSDVVLTVALADPPVGETLGTSIFADRAFVAVSEGSVGDGPEIMP